MVMGLPDAAAEFARQVAIALAGDTGSAQQRWNVDERSSEIVSSQQAEIARLLRQNDRLQVLTQKVHDDWRRVEKLVGREFTSPASVIDRVAYLAEQESERNRLMAERDELLAAIRSVLDNDYDNDSPSLVNLLRIVARIDNKNTREDTS